MQRVGRFKLVLSVLLMAALVGLSVGLSRRSFDVMWAVLMGAAFIWAIFARHLVIGMGAPPFRPTKPIRLIVLTIIACTAFGFVDAALRPPPGIGRWNDLAFVVVESLFVPFVTACVVSRVYRDVAR